MKCKYKKSLLLILLLIRIVCNITVPAGAIEISSTANFASAFSDVSDSAYYAKPVAWAIENGITNGTGDGQFSPDRTCSIAQILTFIWRANDSPTSVAACPFADVSADSPFYPALCWANEKSLTADLTSSSGGCTRAQAVQFLWINAGSPQPTRTVAFSDVMNASSYQQAIAWAVEKGITTGTGDGTTFSPDQTCTRGQIVTFLYRAMEQSELPSDSSFSIRFIDVGQADAALIACDGHYMLIDGGNRADSNVIYTVLKNANVTHLDIVVGTHAHEDHIGGIPGAFNYATADLTLCPVTDYDSNVFQNFKRYAEEKGGGITVPSVGSSYSLGSAEVDILGLNAGSDVNDTSIILKIQYGTTSFLFVGDAERDAEQAVLNSGVSLSSTVLKVGHHGSDTSTSYQFLNEIMPKYAVISCGKDNSYGHPTEAVLSRLRDADVKFYRTDMQGDIVCTSNGSTVTFSTAKTATDDQLMTTGDGKIVGSNSTVTTPESETNTPSTGDSAEGSTGDLSSGNTDTTPSTGNSSSGNTENAPSSDNTSISANTIAWISKTGTKYHSTPTCSNMKNLTQTTVGQAEQKGYTRCKKCW